MIFHLSQCVIISRENEYFVASIFVLVGSMVERSDSVSCYYCNYYSQQPQRATCPQPFNATNASTCYGSMCLNVIINFTGKSLVFTIPHELGQLFFRCHP